MVELFSRRRANRSRAFLGRLSCFEWMESGPCGLCPDFRRFGRGRDADSGGAAIDAVHRKRALLGVNLGVLVAGAFLLMGRLSPMTVYSAQFLIGGSGAFL